MCIFYATAGGRPFNEHRPIKPTVGPHRVQTTPAVANLVRRGRQARDFSNLRQLYDFWEIFSPIFFSLNCANLEVHKSLLSRKKCRFLVSAYPWLTT